MEMANRAFLSSISASQSTGFSGSLELVDLSPYDGLEGIEPPKKRAESVPAQRVAPKAFRAGTTSAAPRPHSVRSGRGHERSHRFSPAGINGRVTQAEVNNLKSGLDQTLGAIEENLVTEVFGETLPLVGSNFRGAWSNNVPGFRYLTTLRTAIVTGLGTLTNAADYSTTNVASAINTRLTSAGFNAGSQVAVTTVNHDVQVAFTTSDTFANTNIPIATDFGFSNLDLQLMTSASAPVSVNATFNFTSGVDGSGFYLNTSGATFQFNSTALVSNLNTAVRFTRLPYRLTDVTTNRTVVPMNFAITLLDPNSSGEIRLGELGSDLLDATLTGNTKFSVRILSSLPASALLPQVGTDLRVLWNFAGALVNPNDDNSSFGNQPSLTLDYNRINLESFFDSFADKALREIDRLTEPLQPLIDVLTFAIPVLSDLGSEDVTVMNLLGVDQGTVSAIYALDLLLDLSTTARAYSNNTNVYVDLGSYGNFNGDLRAAPLNELFGTVLRPVSTTRDPDLNDFMADASGITGLSFPILTDANVIANLLLGRDSTLFTWQSSKVSLSNDFEAFYPVFGPIGITLGGHISLGAQFGFGYDTHGIFDYYLGGSSDPGLLYNGFFAMALDSNGDPLTGISVSAGITAGIEANFVLASAGVEGDITATVGIYLDDQLGEGGRVRGFTLLNTPVDELFYAAGNISAGLRAYIEVGIPPFAVSYDIESPRVVLISFDSRDPHVPVLATNEPGRLVLNIGDRAPLRVYGNLDDRAEEYRIENNSSGGLHVIAFNETNEYSTPFLIFGDGNQRGDLLEVAPDVNVPVHFIGGPGLNYLKGGANNDLLEGGDDPDKLWGNGGDDELRGGGDNDQLNGGPGNDILNGGPGLDTASWLGEMVPVLIDLRIGFFGGAAGGDTLISIERYAGTHHADTIDGSEGPDSLLRGEGGNDTIRGHGGNDVLEGSGGDDTVEGGAGDDLILGGSGADMLDGGPGSDVLSYLGAQSPVTISLLTGLGTRGDADGDVVTDFEVLIGTGLPREPGPAFASGDVLEGDDGTNVIYGMDGADVIRGMGGDDVLYGNHPDLLGVQRPGYDADRIYGGAGNDVLYGQDDDDELDGEAGFDMLFGGPGHDHLFSMDPLSIDFLDGEDGTNRLSADYSDKTTPLVFIVGTNNSHTFPDGDTFTNFNTLGTLIGTATNDVMRLAATKEHVYWNKTIDAGDGDDLVIADSRDFYFVGNTNIRTFDSLAGGLGNDTISFEQSSLGVDVRLSSGVLARAAAGMTMSGFENIIGSNLPDILSGDTNNNIFMPLQTTLGGGERISGGGGMDTLRVDYSTNALVNLAGISMSPNQCSCDEPIALGPNWDVGGNSVLLLYSPAMSRFEITGGATNDRLYGELTAAGGAPATNYNDRFLGMGGNDYIEGRVGDDYIDGGEGNDTLEAGNGSDTVLGGPGNDLITFDYGSSYGRDLADGGSGNDNISNIRFPGSDQTSAGVTTIMQFDGGDGFDTVSADLGNMTNRLVFDEANPIDFDLPNGGYIRNFERFKDITTGNGNDIIILRGRHNNRIVLRSGDDIINPGLGIDVVNGGSGNDTIILDFSVLDDADTGGVTSNGSLHERRRISDGALLDQINNSAFERMFFTGSSKNDAAYGIGGDDVILTGAGNDTLTGNNGNDWLDGGPGADTMGGNSGNDTYIVDNPGDSIVNELSTWGTDTVRASISYTLSTTIEHLVLTGTAMNGTGNSSANNITGNAQNNYLRGEGGNDVLNGGGGAGEIDQLNGGTSADTFVLGEGSQRFYDDGLPGDPGHDGYAIIEDFTPSQSDRLRLAGTVAHYLLGSSPIVGVTGTALYHDSNANGTLEPESDELIAILASPETLTRSNTLTNATYSASVEPAVIGLTALQPLVVNDGSGARFAVQFSIFDPMTNGVLLEIQSSTELGSDPWLTISSKNGTNAWSGTAAVSVDEPVDGSVSVTVADPQFMASRPQQFFRAKISRP